MLGPQKPSQRGPQFFWAGMAAAAAALSPVRRNFLMFFNSILHWNLSGVYKNMFDEIIHNVKIDVVLGSVNAKI